MTQLLSIPSAAARLEVSRAHVYRLIAAGLLRSVELRVPPAKRPKTRVREEDLEAFIEAHTREAPPRIRTGGGGGEVRRIDGI